MDPHDAARWLAEIIAAAEAAGADAADGPGPTAFVEPVEAWQLDAMASAGWTPVRQLLQLRCPLPPSWPIPPHEGITLRALRPGSADEAAWVAVNNRAFAWHPEQGGQTLERMHATMAEPWFEAAGLLLAHDVGADGAEGALLGSCWTKVHPATTADPALGEIFAIGVDPSAHGRGLGRVLTLAGLHHLAGRGLTTGMLYVESDNGPALGLYASIDFQEHHRAVRFGPAGDAP